MLGSVEAASRWVWAVFGKHPLAGDYLTFGDRFPLGGGFAEWVKHGFKEAYPHKEVVREMHSWRFWAKGHGRGSLVCGLVRDSFDSVGRPYPILLIGTGSLHDWEMHWDLLPLACETTWVQMEYLSSQAFRDLKDFAGHVQRIAPPSAEWGECARRSGRMLESWAATDNPASGWARGDMEKEAASLSGKAEAMVSLQRAGRPFPDGKSYLVNIVRFHQHQGEVDLSLLEQQINWCKQQGCDLIIAGLHCGVEWEFFPRVYQIEQAHRLAESGADVIIGHHAHISQPTEWYRTRRDPDRGVPIFYGLGNLVSLITAPYSALSLVARLRLAKGKIHGIEKTFVEKASLTPLLQLNEGRNGMSYIWLDILKNLTSQPHLAK